MKKFLRKSIIIYILITMTFLLISIGEVNAVDKTFTAEDFPYDIVFTTARSGFSHVVAIDEDGYLWTWGTDDANVNDSYWYNSGVLGDQPPESSSNLSDLIEYSRCFPKKISDIKFKDVVTGTDHNIAIDEDGYLWAWGENKDGQLGDGTISRKTSLTPIIGDTRFEKIAACPTRSAAIDIEGNLYYWGGEQLHNGYVQEVNFCKFSTEVKFKEVSVGFNNLVAIDESGNIWGLGKNANGELGTGDTDAIYNLTQLTQDKKYIKIKTGAYHTLAIDEDGNLYGTGRNSSGQLGIGNTISKDDFTSIKSGIKFIEIDAYNNSSMAIDEDGNLWAWGYNSRGQLGDGTEETKTSPIRIKRGMKFIQASISDYVTVILNDQNELWGMGYNYYKTLGKDNKTEELLPIQITGPTKAYMVTFKNGTEIISTQTIEKGQAATAPNISKEGYTLSWDKDFSNVTSDLTVNTIWTANTNTAYKVEHYLRTTDMEVESYSLHETENKTGTTEAMAVAIAKTYEGFTENTTHEERVATGTVTGDGSLVLKLYYNRNSYNITYELNGGSATSTLTSTYLYGKELILSSRVEKQGYVFAGWYEDSTFSGEKVTAIGTEATGDKMFYAKWIQNQFTVIFKDEGITKKTETVEYSESATAPELTKSGYTLSWDKDFSNITSDLTVNAVWTANTNTKYKVEHYLRTTDMEVESYSLHETENKTGTTGTQVTATAKTYDGFTQDTTHEERVATGNVAADGSLVLKLYYNRNTYNITYELNGGSAPSTLTSTYLYGKELILSNRVEKEGYTFAGWYNNSSLTGTPVTSITTTETGNKTFYAKWTQNEFTVTFKDGDMTEKTETVEYGGCATAPVLTKPGYTLSWDKDFSNITSDLTVNAVWTAKTNTPYKLEHYLRTTDMEVESYSLHETENKTGTTGEQVTATAKTYTGFTENTTHSDRIISGTVAADGSLVLKLYYDRNTYNITYELNGGTATSTLTSTYLYGKQIVLSNKVEKEGYTFAGWYDNSSLTGTAVTSISEQETGNKTFYAKWVENDELTISSTKYTINEEERYITHVSPNTKLTAFLSNITTNGIAEVVNLNGNTISAEDFVGTGYKLKITLNGETKEYEIVVRGDIDGNGKITVTDLSMLNQQIVKKITLTGAKEKAADIDYSGKTTVTDLSMLNQALVGKITL